MRAHLQRGSALIETALVVPCLVLLLLWSGAITDVIVLRLKACEAARYALWESTVFRDPARVQEEVRSRFSDLRSPAAVRQPNTGLLLWPRAGDLEVRAHLDTTSREAPIGGSARPLQRAGAWSGFVSVLLGGISRSVDAALRAEHFDLHGVAEARVEIVRRGAAGPALLRGGDLPGLRVAGGFSSPRSLREPRFAAPLPDQRPMTLVFDTWKAWPHPTWSDAVHTRFEPDVSPSKTYPVVEEQVAAQEGYVAFFGLRKTAVGRKLAGLSSMISSAASGYLVGGRLPDLFSTGRMDGPGGGFITILPPERADASWVPSRCESGGHLGPCATQRLGDLKSDQKPRSLDGSHSVGDGVDRTRYTVPYRINTQPWLQSGGVEPEDTDDARLAQVPAEVSTRNASVRTYACRGHFFDGARRGQAPRAHRWAPECGR